MDAHSSSIRCGPQRWRICLSAAAFAMCLSTSVVFAAESTNAERFTLTGSGTLSLDQATQSSGSLKLKAWLTPTGAALAASPPVQENARFAVMATLAAAPSVCYNDTIFRDDFDGDGG